MAFVSRKGKLRFVRVNDLNQVYGPPNDAIHTEVTVALMNSDEGYGFALRHDDPNLPARLAMLTTLRDAYMHGKDVGLAVDLPPGKKNGHLRRVQLG